MGISNIEKTQNIPSRLITALFVDFKKAGKAYNAALKLGYKKDEISILMSEETKAHQGHNRAHENASLSDEAIKGGWGCRISWCYNRLVLQPELLPVPSWEEINIFLPPFSPSKPYAC